VTVTTGVETEVMFSATTSSTPRRDFADALLFRVCSLSEVVLAVIIAGIGFAPYSVRAGEAQASFTFHQSENS
jgi:hypothetical protein